MLAGDPLCLREVQEEVLEAQRLDRGGVQAPEVRNIEDFVGQSLDGSVVSSPSVSSKKPITTA